MEEVLLRFPHIGQQFLQLLRFKDLLKCQKVSQSLKSFINNEKILQFKVIKNKTDAPTQIIWKILRKDDVKFASGLAEIISIAYKRHPKEKGKLSSIIINEILHQAAFKGCGTIYGLLSENVLDVNPKLSSLCSDEILGFPTTTPLHIAARKGHLSVCELIIKHIKDKNPKDASGMTPLHYAAKNGHFQICQLLLESIKKKNPKSSGWIPLDFAAWRGHQDICDLLLKNMNDADINTMVVEDGFTPLHNAAEQGHLSLCELFIQFAKDKNLDTDDNETPLQLTAKTVHEKVVSLVKRYTRTPKRHRPNFVYPKLIPHNQSNAV